MVTATPSSTWTATATLPFSAAASTHSSAQGVTVSASPQIRPAPWMTVSVAVKNAR